MRIRGRIRAFGRPRGARVAFVATVATIAAPAATSYAYENGVTIEAVSDFGGNGDLPNAIPNCTGFQDALVTKTPTGFSAPLFTRGATYTNAAVYDTDFFDPDQTRVATDNDTSNFDKRGNAISYLCAHGEDQSTTCEVESCRTSADCQSAASWRANSSRWYYSQWNEPHSCVTPRNAPTRCCYKGPRPAFVNSISSKHGNRIDYGTQPGVKFGESATSGGWAGAGTNGGAKLVILDISHGTVPGVSGEILSNMFAGMWVVMTIMPVAGDTASVSNRGSTLADKYLVNPSGSPSYAWTDTMNSLPGGGINGDGCYVAFGMDADAFWVDQHVTKKRWVDFTNDNFDSTGNSYWQQVWACNYDTSSFPPSN